VLHYIPSSQIGGTEISVLNLCRAMSGETVGVIFKQAGPVLKRFEESGIPTVALDQPGAEVRVTQWAADSNVLNITVYSDSTDIDVIRTLTGLPTVVTLQWYARLGPRDMPIACASQAVAAIQDRANETITVHNGVDIERFRPPQQRGTSKPLVVARLCRAAKSSRVFPRIAETLLAERPDIELWLIGEEGPSSDRLKYLGLRNDVDEILRQVDVVIHTPNAKQGAHDLAILEAMATGLPIVAFDVECVRESFPNSDVGILVPYNDVRAAANQVIALLDDPVRRQSIGRAARTLVEQRFTIQRTAGKYRQIYHTLISKELVSATLD